MAEEQARQAPSDEELMTAYVGGDQRAFGQLFERYAPVLVGISRRSGLSSADAHDLVQQTFLQLHRARRDFRPGAKLRPWLMTIAFNLKRDHFRRLGRRKEVDLREERVEAKAPHVNGVQRRQEVERLRSAMQKLPPDQREVIDLHWFAEVPFPEIAETLGVKLSTVKVRAHRGYKRLRQLLAEQGV